MTSSGNANGAPGTFREQLEAQAALSDPKTPLEYITAYCTVNDIKVTARRDVWLKSRRDKVSDLENLLFYSYEEFVRQKRADLQAQEEILAAREGRKPKVVSYRGFTPRVMELAFQIYIKEQADKSFEEISKRISFDASVGDDPVDRLLGGILEAPSALDKAVFKHLLWQVKRKIHGRPIKWELWANFLGRQGGGKTYFTRKLGAVLGDLYEEGKMSEIISDSRFLFILQHVYFMSFEELEKATKVEMESIKALMSKDRLTWRKLGKNASDTGFNNCTFLSTSNRSLLDVFYDPTGMRRFYEMRVKDRLDREVINTTDYVAIWRSIDENADEPPITAHLEELQAYQQEHLVQKTPLEMFIEEGGYRPAAIPTERNKVKARDLYRKYRDYCDECGYNYPVSEIAFSRVLKDLGFNKTKRTSTGFHYHLEQASAAAEGSSLVGDLLKLPTIIPTAASAEGKE
jgi:hypothetical protein